MRFLTRRLFFGAAAGATVAPMLTNQATGQGMAPMLPTAPPPYYGENAKDSPWSNADYARDLRRKAAGQFTEEEQENFRNNGPWINQADNIESLRSISPGQKQRMRADYAARERDRWIENAKRELAQMAKRRSLGL